MSAPKQALLKRLQLQQQRSKEAYAEFEKSAADTPRHQLAKRKSAELESGCASAAVPERDEQHLVSADVVSNKKSKRARSAPSPSSKAGGNAPLSRLQNRFSEKLKGAHFRYLNEFLYSNPSGDAISKYAADPSLFDAYHSGYRLQVESWPENPLDRMIRYCAAKIAASSPPNVVAIGDFGCGEARLAATLRSDKSLRAQHRIHSFDLVAANSLITACDIAKVPLKASSLDIAVFCLSLMGTNFEDFLLEARRSLKIGGHLLIAEVQSRLPSVQEFIDVVLSLGFSMVVKDLKNSHFIFFEFEKIEDRASTASSRNAATGPLLKVCKYKKR